MPVQKNKNMFRVFLSYSIPCIIAMFLTSFITVVDGIFIGAKMGGNGLAAVNLTLPVLYILLALTIMIGVGGVTLASHSLGEKNHHQANQKFTFALTINLLLNLVCFITLFCFQEQIIGLLNAKGNIYGYVRDYLGTMKYFYLFMMLNLTFSMFIRSEGKPQLSLLFSLAGNIINIILDYLFIIKFNWGMKGAAVASGISVIIPFVFGIGYFLSRRSVYKFVNFNFQWPV
jgi:putative MATE family efflux protein